MSTAPNLPTNPLDQQRLIDKAQKKPKDIYSSSHAEIFSKNFVAGFARSLGGIVVYLIFISVVTVIIANTLLPRLQAMLAPLTQSLNSLNPQNSQNQSVSPALIEQLLQKYQR